ncbi:YitT family protein [Lutibacter sp. A80]|uniref:YitT family protein n=1 Tax=unclassified Lutibacter TaxID=2626258 RepID=UPI001F06D9DE|nr:MULTISPECIES: YitT family protein [unclassified Lutibacter]UMB53562.1 YitT family protein [Lutibacter sp. A64]UMB62148.1 YitT family protein [Lutibacter sp. A80]
MIAFIHNLIVKTVKRRFKKSSFRQTKRLSEEVKSIEVSISHSVREVFFILIGVVSAGFGLKGFLLPNSFIDGGAMGISLLISDVTGYSLSVLIVLINLPFIVLGYSNIGKQFALKSILAIIALALSVHFIPYPLITSDKLLIAVFGGFFLGGGIGMSIRGGAVIDGTEVLAIFLSKKSGLTIGDIILIFNIIIFSFGAYILSIEVALYAMLTYMAAAKTIDFIIEGVEEYTGISIISTKSEKIRLMITEDLGRGVTVYVGKGGFGKQEQDLTNFDIIYTIVTRLEIARIKTEIEKIDEHAFIIMNSIKDTKGGMIKKRPLK